MMYVLVSNHILMNEIHLIHHFKPIYHGIHKIGFEYAQGCNSFEHIATNGI
jgi:hypothetical protein